MASTAPGVSEAARETPAVKEDSLTVLKALAEASAVFIALTFIGGWSYLASYYKTFGLNPLELDLSIGVVSAIAVDVLSESVWGWPLFVAGALIVAVALLTRRLRNVGRGLIVAVLGVLLLIVATAGEIGGRSLANRDALTDSAALPNVSFESKLKDPEQPSCVDFGTFGTLDCKLLLHYKNTYYFFLPVPIQGVGSINLYMLSDSDLVGVHVQRGLERNARIE